MDFLRKLNNFCLAKINKQVIPRRGRIKRYGGDYMVKMLDTYHNLSRKDIEDFETKNNIKLTDHYKEVLLNVNGVTTNIGVFMISEWGGETVKHYFHSIDDTYYDIEDFMDILDLRLPEGFIPIGNDGGGNALLLGISELHYDRIYFWDHEQEVDEPDMSNMYFLADNIWEFLDNLYEDESDDEEE